MADFKAIFEESGLVGIVPYAFNMNGKGYDFLCDKLKNGERFWGIYSDENCVPFISIDEETNYVYFSLFSSPEQAEQFTLQLAANDFRTAVVEINTDVNKNVWLQYRDLGISHLRFDDAIWISIADLAPKATYDGMLNAKLPIRNERLNMALYYMLQFIDADIRFDNSVAYFWRLLQESFFYVPIRPLTPLKKGEALKPENSDYHHATTNDGEDAILAFTDQQFLESYALQNHLKPEDYTAAYTPDFEHLKKFMEDTPDVPIILNTCHGSLTLTLDLFEEMERISLNQAAVNTGSSVS